MNIFMKANKNKLRFNTDRGVLSVECLWDLDLDELDTLTMNLKKAVNESAEEGYLSSVLDTVEDKETFLKFEIAEAIILERVSELQARAAAAVNKQKRDKLLAIIASKEAQELAETDIETLREMVDELS